MTTIQNGTIDQVRCAFVYTIRAHSTRRAYPLHAHYAHKKTRDRARQSVRELGTGKEYGKHTQSAQLTANTELRKVSASKGELNMWLNVVISAKGYGTMGGSETFNSLIRHGGIRNENAMLVTMNDTIV